MEGYDIIPLRGNKVRIEGKSHDLTPDIPTAFTDTKYTFNISNMNDAKVLTFHKILKTVQYDRSEDSNSKRSKSIKKKLKKRMDKILNPPLSLPPTEIENESDLQGEAIKILITSNIIDIWTRLEVLLGLKPSGQTNCLTEASNLTDELYKRGKLENEQQYQNALDKVYTKNGTTK